MNTSNEHKENKSPGTIHNEKLGMTLPEDYFSRSKEDILAATAQSGSPRRLIFGLRPVFAYPIAASLILLIGLLFWTRTTDSEFKTQLTESETLYSEFPSEDVLISSLLVSDSEMDSFVDDYILNEVLYEAERSEQELENIFMNSLFVDDSLIDVYVDKNLIEKVVL